MCGTVLVYPLPPQCKEGILFNKCMAVYCSVVCYRHVHTVYYICHRYNSPRHIIITKMSCSSYTYLEREREREYPYRSYLSFTADEESTCYPREKIRTARRDKTHADGPAKRPRQESMLSRPSILMGDKINKESSCKHVVQ